MAASRLIGYTRLLKTMRVNCDENIMIFKDKIRKYASRHIRNLRRPFMIFSTLDYRITKKQDKSCCLCNPTQKAEISFKLFHTNFMLFMTPKMLLGIPFKSFNDLTANKAFHHLLCCLHDKKNCSTFHIEGPLLYISSSIRFIFKDITNYEMIKLLCPVKS